MPIRGVISSPPPPFLSLEADYVAHLYFKQASSVVGFLIVWFLWLEDIFFSFFWTRLRNHPPQKKQKTTLIRDHHWKGWRTN